MGNAITHKSNLLTIEEESDDSTISLKWIGKSADRTPGLFINPILTAVLNRSEADGREIVLDFRELEFMNSSSIAPIVKTLDRAKRGNTKMTIRYNKNLNWQELSFSALVVFQTKDNRIKIIGV